MKVSLNNDLPKHYKKFGQNHQCLREQMLATLPEAQWKVERVKAASRREIASSIFFGVKLRSSLRIALAAAAVFMIAFGILAYVGPGYDSPQAAWAAAVENAGQVQSVHFRFSTGNSSVEMWCRHPQKFRDFRAEYNNGLVTTNNHEKRCHYNNKTNILSVRPADEPPLEKYLLGELGKLFLEKSPFSGNLIDESKLLHSEKVIYKGEQCLKMIAEMKGDRFEYILDKKDPLIFEVKRYSPSGKLKSHMEVLDVDRNMPDSLFIIDPKGKKTTTRNSK